MSAVAIFGLGTIVLGLATNFVIAFLALMVLSGADAISVYIRASLVPLATPEEMRGRVLAVEGVFIGASNELGAVESGLTAAAFGLVGAILFGGFGTLAAVANAVQDALWEIGIQQVDMPFTSEKIWSMINSGKLAAE